MSLRYAVLSKYKQLLYLGREYPLGYDYFRNKCKSAFMKNRLLNNSEDIQKRLAHADYVIKEIEALYMLRKYRTLKKRYIDLEPLSVEEDQNKSSPRSS